MPDRAAAGRESEAAGRAVHVAVVGAGAAGLTVAIAAAQAGAHVTLLNAHPRAEAVIA